MKTSELEGILLGLTDVQQFCSVYHGEKGRLLSRKDGAATSGDLGLSFDSGQVVVTAKQVLKFCNSFIECKVSISDLRFLATLLLLSGFEFDSENTEDAMHLLADLSSEGIDTVHEVQKMLSPEP